MKKKLLLVGLFIGLLAVSDFTSAKSQSVKINKEKFNISMKVGDKLKIKHTKLGAKKVKWKSTNKSVAAVSAKGVLKAKKAGKTTITAKSGKIKVTGNVKVEKKNKKNITPVATAAPMPVPTPVLTATPVPTVTLSPESTSKSTATPVPTEKVKTSGDILLKFNISQESITKDTKIISGHAGAYNKVGAPCYDWSKKFGNILVTLSVGETVIAEQIVTEDDETFSFDVDLSEYEIDTDILIQTTPTEGNIFTVEGEYSICDYMVHGMYKTIWIGE